MNWSIYTADRTTHLKIVVVGLAAALLVSTVATLVVTVWVFVGVSRAMDGR